MPKSDNDSEKDHATHDQVEAASKPGPDEAPASQPAPSKKSDSDPPPANVKASLLDRALGVVTEVRPGEGITALLLTFNVFLVLCSYYVIKPVREALIGSVENGPQYKSYMGAAIAATLFFAVPAYSRFASKWPRNKLIMRVSLFFVSNLVAFYFVSLTPWVKTGLGATLFALGFLLWVGVFNMMIVAQFWAFAADVYTEKQGKRLFALVGLGASLGSVAGSLVVDRVVETLGTSNMMLVSAALLFGASLITQVIHKREIANSPKLKDGKTPEEPKSTEGAYSLVLKHKYLLLIALFTVLFSVANTSGEFMLSQLAKEASKQHATTQEAQKLWIAGYFGSYFLWVNIAGLVIQTFLVSRIIKYFGFGVAFFIFPVVALMSTSAIIAIPMLLTVRIGKTGENSIDYSLNNTVRNMLWLPTTRRMKYLAKQATDSFFARMGDVLSALGVLILFRKLELGVRGIAVMNAVLIVLWLYIAWRIVVENKIMVEKQAKGQLDEE